MSDRSKAYLFAELFQMFAKDMTDESKWFAHQVWKMTFEYDFLPCQMECDDALELLGLAKPDMDGDYPVHAYLEPDTGEFVI